ncbi:MAG: hypothetical protein ACPIOQ_81250, partial [Promethearchaeia archaeon]
MSARGGGQSGVEAKGSAPRADQAATGAGALTDEQRSRRPSAEDWEKIRRCRPGFPDPGAALGAASCPPRGPRPAVSECFPWLPADWRESNPREAMVVRTPGGTDSFGGLSIVKKDGTHSQRFPLVARRYLIGRAEYCDIRINLL